MKQLTSSENGFLRNMNASKARHALSDSSRSQGCALLRLLPKPEKGDVRPIMNLSSRTRAAHARRFGKATLSVNASLADVFAVLDGERRRRVNLTGSSVFDLDCIHKRLRPFVLNFRKSHQKIYIVSADVAHCYDSIDQRKLLSLLQNSVVVDSEYEVRRTSSVMFSGDTNTSSLTKLMTRRSRLSLPLGCSSNTTATNSEERNVKPVNIENEKIERLVVDGIVRKYMKRRDVMSEIQTHVKRNIVRMGNQYFSQVKGVR